MITKICSSCEIIKNIDCFYFRKSQNRYINKCIECVRKKVNKYYSINKKKKLQYRSEYYNKNKEKICNAQKEYGKIYYLKNKESINNKSKEYSNKNPILRTVITNNYRSKKFNSFTKISVYEYINLFNKQNGKCNICFSKMDTNRKITTKKCTIDHIIPLSENGTNSINNIQLLCFGCNASKKNKNTVYKVVL